MPEPTETATAARLRREREEKAQKLAIETAVSEERVRAKLQQHDEDIKELREGHIQMNTVLGQVQTAVQRLVTLGEAASKESANSLSAKQFYVGLASVAVALTALFLGIHGAGG